MNNRPTKVSDIAKSISSYMQGAPVGHPVDVTDIAKTPTLRGVHFGRIIKACDMLDGMGHSFDEVSLARSVKKV